jgi:HEPN domain-containing protein
LIYLLNKIDLKPPENIARFLVKLNEASVITRYPEDLEKLKSIYTKKVVKDIISESKEALQWIKKQF